jgi:glycosidase
MEGYKDPFNRGCYPWGHENKELQDWYKKIIKLRKEHSVYKTGHYRTVAAHSGLFAFERYGDDPREISVMTVANCGDKGVRLRLHGRWKDILSGKVLMDNTTVIPGETLLLEHGY